MAVCTGAVCALPATNYGAFEMADPTPTEADGAEPATEKETEIRARPGHKDKGTVVTTAFGEKMSGGLADIADGDS